MNIGIPEKFYETLVENASDVVAVVDEAGIIAFVNSRVEYYRGLSALETMGRHYSEFVHSDDLERFQTTAEQAFAGAPVVDFEFRAIPPDGTVRCFVANGGRTELDGRPVMMAICRDVTESKELKAKLVARNEALSALSEIAVGLSASSDLDLAMRQAVDRILAIMGLTTGAIFLRDVDGRVRISASTPSNMPEIGAEAAAAGKLISQQCIEMGRRIVVPDILDPSVDPLAREMARALGIEALVSVPLRAVGETRAALSLGVPKPGALSIEQIEFLDTAAGILGRAIENAVLQSDLRDRVERLAMLERLAKSINAARDVDTVLKACMSEIAHLVPYDVAVVVLFRSDKEAEQVMFGSDGSVQSTRSMLLNDEQVARIGSITEAVSMPCHEAIGHYHSQPESFQADRGSGAVLPLVCLGRKFGLLKVWTQSTERYGRREMEILDAAAEHLSIAAFNATLYEAEQQKSLQLAALAKEAQHRIKNNLQMVSGMLSVQDGECVPSARTLHRCQRQLQAISDVNDMISLGEAHADVGLIDCVSRIAHNALQATGRGDSIALRVSGDDCLITSDSATALGVLINELISNSVEHGFEGSESGRIEITTECKEAFCTIEVIDDGKGLSQGFALPDEHACTATGLGLLSKLAAYGLGGKLELEAGVPRGTVARISLKGVC